MVTIGLPVYNSGIYLKEAIDSILSQVNIEFELIIINDGSTDNSMNIINEYANNKNIRIYNDGINKGLASRLNEIINLSRYNYIARMDSDDISLSNRLYEQVKFLETNDNYDVVCTKVECIDKDGLHQGYRGIINGQHTFYSIISGKSGIVHPTIVARKSWCERNFYNVNNYRAEDYELWLLAFIKNDLKIHCIKNVLLKYRIFPSDDNEKRVKSYKDQFRFLTSIIFKIIPYKYTGLSFYFLFILLLKILYIKMLSNLR